MAATTRIYVASLSDYNAGTLHGVWIDLEGASEDSVFEQIEEMLAESPAAKSGEIAEEWAIHDYDMEGLTFGEGESISKLVEIAEAIHEHGSPFVAFLDNVGGDCVRAADVVASFQDCYVGQYDSLRAYAEELFDEMHADALKAHPELAQYIDYDSYANDLKCGGDVWTADAPGGVYVFTS